MDEAELTREWLAEAGVVEVSPGVWDDEGVQRDTLDMAQVWARSITRGRPDGDDDWDPAFALRLTFGLLDLLGEHWVTVDMQWLVRGEPVLFPQFWEGYRRRLEVPEEPEAITYSLRVSWFEDVRTAGTAFEEVLGRDLAALRSPPPGLLLRAGHVLRCSGPVAWELKRAVYEAAADVPELRQAVFRGLLLSYHEVYGKLEPDGALALLRRLDLPEDTEHLARLRTVLEAGHSHHHSSPDAWGS